MSQIHLTDREDEVLRLAIGGSSNDEIAACLSISRRTVEAHMRTLFRKTGVSRRGQLAALYQAGDVGAGLSAPEELDGVRGPGRSQSRVDLASYERQLRRYADAVRGLVDRQYPLFEERVEITLTIGDQDGQDLVVERRWTTPRPYLVYRIVGPIVSWPNVPPSELDDLAVACTVQGQDIQVEIHPVRDVNDRPLLLILFQPGLHGDTEWVLRYRSPALWSPLRASGQDSLTWSTATFDQRHPATTRDLTLKVAFPIFWTAERLTEQSNVGTIHTERLSTGQTQLTWHHDAPHVGAYHWLLEGSPSGT
ncbi:MAG: helix-turn-helix domain-containing protein [Pseudonocardiaceae bacterium]